LLHNLNPFVNRRQTLTIADGNAMLRMPFAEIFYPNDALRRTQAKMFGQKLQSLREADS
jgi:hypothetical protein